jgi:hypothetical protein
MEEICINQYEFWMIILNEESSGPLPPVEGDFLLLDGTPFLLLDGTPFSLL